MNSSIKLCAAVVIALLLASGCTWTKQDTGTAVGAVAGGVVGSAVTGGSTAGAIGGAVVGGFVGNRATQ
jgi:osmotically inducible lipoprotein OsmB